MIRCRAIFLLVLLAALFLLPAAAPGQSLRDLLRDDEDGQFDVSELLFSRLSLGFLPIPIVITEPAVGYGGGLAAVWFHQMPDRTSRQLVPPSVSIGAGLLTSDGSWAGAGGHFHSWKKDTWRLLGGGGRASLDLESVGISPQLDAGGSIEYSLDSSFFLVEGSRKVTPSTRLGLRYVYVDTEVGLGGEDLPADLSGQSTVGGLGLLLSFDSRDNVMSPRRGQRFELRPAYYGEAFGGDVEYVRADALYTGYWRRDPLGFALKVDAAWSDDGAPFYAKPFIVLRGVPAMGYLGQEVVAVEPQIDWNVTSRWTLLAFGGAGRATNDLPLGGNVDQDVYSGGVGFRYLLARVLGLQAGLDFAWSSEGDHAFYIVAGNAWR